jgi:hypothetical protein
MPDIDLPGYPYWDGTCDAHGAPVKQWLIPVADVERLLARLRAQEGIVAAAVEWRAAADHCRALGFGPIEIEGNPESEARYAEHVRESCKRQDRFHQAYVQLEAAVDAFTDTSAAQTGATDERGAAAPAKEG